MLQLLRVKLTLFTMIKTEGTEDASAVGSETHSVYYEQRLKAPKMLQLLRVKLTLTLMINTEGTEDALAVESDTHYDYDAQD